MIPNALRPLIESACSRVSVDGAMHLSPSQCMMLHAAIHAMADQFADLRFAQIPTLSTPNLLEFFCDTARHWWAQLSQGDEVTPASLTAAAIRCPHSDAAIIGLVMAFEQQRGELWNPDKARDRLNLTKEAC